MRQRSLSLVAKGCLIVEAGKRQGTEGGRCPPRRVRADRGPPRAGVSRDTRYELLPHGRRRSLHATAVMKGPVTSQLTNVVRRVVEALDSDAVPTAQTCRRFADAAETAAHTYRDTDIGNSHPIEEASTKFHEEGNGQLARSASTPSQRPGFRRSAAEEAMAVRRLTTDVPFTGDMRVEAEISDTEVRKMGSDDGELNIYKPDAGEVFDGFEDYITPAPGALTNREVAAFRVGEFLGFGRIPPTAHHTGPGPDLSGDGWSDGPGMIQQFVDSQTSRDVGDYLVVQQHQVAVIDYIIGVVDRHPGNWRTIDHGDHFEIVTIDHGRSFPSHPPPLAIEFGSDFIRAHKGHGLDQSVLDAAHAIDIDDFRGALTNAGLDLQAVDGAVTRLEKIRELDLIPADALTPMRFY